MGEEKKEEKNEFEQLDTEEGVPDQEFSGVPDGQEDMISSGGSGIVYDWQNAPDDVAAPPREDLDGQELEIKKADIILPPKDRDWQKTRSGDKLFKYCTFKIYYDKNGQVEYYSGVRIFKRDDGKYSHPSVMRDRKNQASNLLGMYADFKGKDINEVSIREFMGFLNSGKEEQIKCGMVKNPA